MEGRSKLFAHVAEDEYKKLIDIEEKYYELLAEREDISKYKDALAKLYVGEVVIDIRHNMGKYRSGFYSIDSWDKMNMLVKILFGDETLKKSMKNLYDMETKHKSMYEFNISK